MGSVFRVSIFAGASALALVAIGGAATATPVTITPTSDFTVAWSGLVGTAAFGAQAGAQVELSNFSFPDSNTVTFHVLAKNTTTGTSPGYDVRFTSFGWVTDPGATASTNTSTVFASATNATLNNSLKLSGTELNVCLYSGENCNGGSTGGLEDPQNTGLHGDPTQTTFDMTLSFSNPVPPLTFSGFYGKFQSYWGSTEVDGGTVTPGTTGGGTVPEPSSLSLFGTGLIGLGGLFIWAERRRRKAAA